MTTVLFADDDPRILSGLRRQLHGAGTGWECTFAPGGPEALQALERESLDVVVSDMLMPVVDGAQVLAATAELHPRAARLVLSGHADPDRARLCTASAHRYLDKPCPVDRLLLAIQEAVALRAALDVLGDPVLDAIWSRPPASGDGGALVLLGAAHAAPKTLPDDVAALLGRQPVLLERAREVLGRAHGRAQVGASARAMTEAFGVGPVLWTLVGVRLLQQLGQGQDGWVAARRRASLAAEVAREQGLDDEVTAQALLAGLLHGAFAGKGGEERARALDWLLPAWGLPQPVVEALSLPENAVPSGPGPAAALLAARLLDADGDADGLCGRLDGLGWGTRVAAWRERAGR